MSDNSSLIDELLILVVSEAEANRPAIESTYRFQLHAGFTFENARSLVPYLKKLGITHVYMSPYLKATPKSTHGYDVIDHTQLNPELGTEEEYRKLVAELRNHGMGQIMDLVPNHMGIATDDNGLWRDVLTHGLLSPYAFFFDITWNAAGPNIKKVMLPVLGNTCQETLEKGLLNVKWNGASFVITYGDRSFPINSTGLKWILTEKIEATSSQQVIREQIAPIISELNILTEAMKEGGISEEPFTDTSKRQVFYEKEREISSHIAQIMAVPEVRSYLEERLARLNGNKDNAESFDQLNELISMQHYSLVWWKLVNEKNNYRRFFNVSELAALSMEREEVFTHVHSFPLTLAAEGAVAGFRIDHPDGLYDPKEYCMRLQQHYLLTLSKKIISAHAEFKEIDPNLVKDKIFRYVEDRRIRKEPPLLYVVVEKIVAEDENLPEDWVVDGMTGYDLLVKVNGLFIDPEKEHLMTECYSTCTAFTEDFSSTTVKSKSFVLSNFFRSELSDMAQGFHGLAEKDSRYSDLSLEELRGCIAKIIAVFPVYRTYIAEGKVSSKDRSCIEAAVEIAGRINTDDPHLPNQKRAAEFVRSTLLLEPAGVLSEVDLKARGKLVGKFQQLTSPVMAKGVEDTAFYRYNRLVSANEVGGNPGRLGISSDELHTYLTTRVSQSPYALSPLSTHDTKWSEDVRARLNVVSELPEEWREACMRWMQCNNRFKKTLNIPDRNEEYLLYQALLGTWPLETAECDQIFLERFHKYSEKALHEAKVHSAWGAEDTAYEEVVRSFIDDVLNPVKNPEFLSDFLTFHGKVSFYGMLNSLSQNMIRLTAPGIPDIYQGTEIWNFSFVDPDNRRPVEYSLLQKMIEEDENQNREMNDETISDQRHSKSSIEDPHMQMIEADMQNLKSGRCKLQLISNALKIRQKFPGLFTRGRYISIEAEKGKAGKNVFSFLRTLNGEWALTVAPRFYRELCQVGELPIGTHVWKDAVLPLPVEAPHRWWNINTGETIGVSGSHTLELSEILSKTPVALLIGLKE